MVADHSLALTHQGCYRLARLAAKYGAEITLSDLLKSLNRRLRLEQSTQPESGPMSGTLHRPDPNRLICQRDGFG
jgi:hypothetical protein